MSKKKHEQIECPDNAIIRYVRDENNNPFGVMVAFRKNDMLYIGWSRCSEKDIFVRSRGKFIAANRARKHWNNDCEHVHWSMREKFRWFVDMAVRKSGANVAQCPKFVA